MGAERLVNEEGIWKSAVTPAAGWNCLLQKVQNY